MKNFRFTLRMLKQNPLLVFVNIPGLAIGLCVVILLSVYLKYELSFDKHFKTKDRVVRLFNVISDDNSSNTWAICLRDAYAEIPKEVPEVEASCQIYRGWNVNVKTNDDQFPNLNLLYSDPELFKVFGLNLIAGDSNTALDGDKKVVINSSIAQKIFGKNDCLGEILKISDENFIVSGVIEDLPKATHFNFDLLASMKTIKPEEFGGLEFFTYYLIHKNADFESAKHKIAEANNGIMNPWIRNFNRKIESGAERLDRLHLHTKSDINLSPKGNLTNIYIVAGIAFFILLIALVNYINLYVLHGEKRITEIASRRSLGANSTILAKLFYTETGIIGIASFIIAIILTFLVQPFFAKVMHSKFEISELLTLSGVVLSLSFLGLLILISGAYPSFYLSRINLVNALKGKSDKVKRKSRLTSVSVISQFAITAFLISSLLIVYSQIDFLKKTPLGFTAENVIGISGFDNQIKKSYKSIEDEFEQLTFVESVGSSYHSMGGGCSGQGIWKHGDSDNIKSINEYRVLPGFCKTMKLELSEGRYFNDNVSDKQSIILNQSAVTMLGLKNPVGTMMNMHGKPKKVIGVVNDFYYHDKPGEPIAPLVLTNYRSNVSVFYLRINGDFTSERKAQIAAILKQYDPEFIFGHFHLTDIYANKFYNEERLMKLVSSGAVLAIVISFIGLMALSILSVTRRTKEIGVRKVMGSKESEIMGTLLRETMILISISILLSFTCSYFVMREWLNGFVDKINLHAGYFFISGLIAISIALLAVSWQSWKAATRNPVEALRYE